MIYTNSFKSIFLSISGLVFPHLPDFSLTCCLFPDSCWKKKKSSEKFLACYKMLFPVNQPPISLWSCFLTVFLSSDPSWTSNCFKNCLLNSRKPRTACFSLNWLPNAPSTVLLQDNTQKSKQVLIPTVMLPEKMNILFYVRLTPHHWLLSAQMGIHSLIDLFLVLR